MTSLTSGTHRLEVVPGGGPFLPQRVLLGTDATDGTCVLTVGTVADHVRAVVDVLTSPEVPPGTVAVHADLAADLGLVSGSGPWRLDSVNPVDVRRLVLEMPTERDPKDVARDVARSAPDGRLLWVSSTGDVWFPVDDVPYRVREIDTGGWNDVAARVTAGTKVELYAPAARAGVDIVVLADVSGSMVIDDLPVTGERPRRLGQHGWITRAEALREALHDLLGMRLRVSGRVSQIALLQFANDVTQRFPRRGGMVQLDGGSSDQLVDEFRQAIGMLIPSNAGTDIGNAVHTAANLLYQHGRPGNEQLIVLVSDGADWTPAGEQGTGEMVLAHQEPVSLMAHLNQDMGIKLHAIGISTKELFDRRGTWHPHPSSVPNHTLLEQMIKVGGGDPTTVGGLDVLEEYFTDLGSGIVHQVTDRLSKLPSGRGALVEDTRAALRALATPERSWEADRHDRQQMLSELVGRCDDEADRATGRSLWQTGDWSRTLTQDCARTVSSDAQLARFVRALVRSFVPDTGAAERFPAGVIDPWTTLLRDLDSTVTGDAVDWQALSTLCRVRIGSAAEAQVAVLGLCTEILDDLLPQLLRLPDAAEEPADDGPEEGPTRTFTFRYRD